MSIVSKSLQNLGNWCFNWSYERDKTGNHWYHVGNQNACWADLHDKINVAIEHPILMPALNYRARHFSNVSFDVIDNEGVSVGDHWMLDLLEEPNPDQSKTDLLEQYIWYKYVFGFVYLYPIGPKGFQPSTLYNLDSSLIKYPENFKTKFILNTEKRDQQFLYDDTSNEQRIRLTMDDIIPFYDLPNGLRENFLVTAPSRLDALKKPLHTVNLAYDAKNVAIKTNGREMFTSSDKDMTGKTIGDREKSEIERRLMNNYGLGAGKMRSIATGVNIKYQSLHIQLADLGLDESVINDAEKIVIGMGIPPNGLRYNANESTFENQKTSEINFIQNEIQTEMDDFTNSLTNKYLKQEGLQLIGKYDHLPILQNDLNKKFDTILKKLEVLKAARETGLNIEDSISLSELQIEELEEQINTEENEATIQDEI